MRRPRAVPRRAVVPVVATAAALTLTAGAVAAVAGAGDAPADRVVATAAGKGAAVAPGAGSVVALDRPPVAPPPAPERAPVPGTAAGATPAATPTTASATAPAERAASDGPPAGRAAPSATAGERAAGLRTPDLLALVPRSLTAAQVERLGQLAGVTALSVADVGTVRVRGAEAVVYGIDPATFRPFTPAPSARSAPLWRSLGRGELTASFDMARQLRLPLGGTIVAGVDRSAVPVRVGAFASMGLPATDAVVDRSRSARLGLAPDRAVLLAAPEADPVQLRAAVRRVLGAGAAVDLLHRVVALRDPGSVLPRQRIAAVLAAATSRLGAPYVWGATGPDSFDCSGLVGWAYHQAGISLPRTAAQLWYAGPHVPYAQARPGDLLFWSYDPTAPGFINHVAIYLGGGKMIVAPRTGDVVRIKPVPMGNFRGVVRVDPGDARAVGGPRWLGS